MSSPNPDTSRRVLAPAALPPAPGWSHGIEAGGWVFGSGLLASDFRNGLLPGARPDSRRPWSVEPLDLESSVVLDMVDAVLRESGSDIRQDLLRVWQWLPATYPDDTTYARSRAHWPTVPNGTPYARNLATRVADPLRSSTGVGVRQLPIPDAMLAFDFIGLAGGSGAEKVGVDLPSHLPAPKIGYSPAIRHGDWVFLAGFGATDFVGDWMSEKHMGEPSMVAPAARVNPYIWLGSEIETQTRYTLQIMAQIAEAAGSSLDRCVKADVTLTHASDFPGMDRVWREFFPDSPPARTVNTGAQLVVKGLRLEVALVLLSSDSAIARRTVQVDSVPAPPGHASQAVQAGEFLFTSGLLPIDGSGAVPEEIAEVPGAPYFRDPAGRQSEILVQHVADLCDAVGTSLEQVCKVQAFLSDLGHLPAMLATWRSTFPIAPPALSSVAMGGGTPLLLPGSTLQWDVIAHVPSQA